MGRRKYKKRCTKVITEKKFQSRFNNWVKYKYKGSGVFELKITKNGSLPFSRLLPHQKASLLSANNNSLGLVYKIADDSVGYKPFDSFILRQVPAWVVVMFYERGQNEFWLIPIKLWCVSEANTKRKSLTLEGARAIGVRCEL